METELRRLAKELGPFTGEKGMLKESGVTFLTRVALFGTSAAMAIFTARLLGAEGRGVYALLMNLVALLVLAANLGLGMANVYFAGRRQYGVGVLAWNSFASGLILGVMGMGAAWALFMGAPQAFQGVGHGMLWLAAAALPLMLAAQFWGTLLLGRQRIIAYNILSGMQGVAGAALVVAALFMDPRVEAVLVAFLLSAAFTWATNGGYLCVAEKEVRRPVLSPAAFKAALGYGFKGQLGNIVQFLNYRLSFFLVNFFLGPAAVGVFSIATVLAESLWYVTNSIATVLFPKVSALQGGQSAALLTAQACRVGLALTVGLALVLGLAAPLFVSPLFGRDFSAAAPVLGLLLPGVVVFSIANVLASFIAGAGFPQYNAVASGASFLAAVALNLLLIPAWGLSGAGVAASGAYGVGTAVTMLFYRRLTGATLETLWRPRGEDWVSLLAAARRFRGRVQAWGRPAGVP